LYADIYQAKTCQLTGVDLCGGYGYFLENMFAAPRSWSISLSQKTNHGCLLMNNKKKNLSVLSGKLSYALRLKKLSNAIHSAPNFSAVLIGLREEILTLYEAEMVTIYLIDSGKKEIFSWSALPGDRLEEIRIPVNGKGIASYVAQTGKIVNVRDVYNKMELLNIDPDLSFDSGWDRKSGIKTKQVLAVPILFNGEPLGVIQLINKKNGRQFTVDNQNNLLDLTETLGIAFHNLHKFSRKTVSRYDMLIKNGIISEQDLTRAQILARQQRKDVESVLLKDFRISHIDLGNALALYYKIPYEDLSSLHSDSVDLVKGINMEYFKKARCVPLAKKNGKVVLATNDPHDHFKIQEIMRVLRTAEVEFRLALKEDIEHFINRQKATAGNKGEAAEKSFMDILEEMKADEYAVAMSTEETEGDKADERAIVLLVRKIIEDAYQQKASDIHLEPYGFKQDAEVRFRIDGFCKRVLNIPGNSIRAVISRFKILARLDIAERRKPQDGKIKFKTKEGKEIELRVSTIPTVEGNEDVVIRLLADSEPLRLEKIMPQKTFKRFSERIRKPHGMILVVGPTGSGKTTTLHSALSFINMPEKKIWTSEDPVEITQYGLRQVQVNPKIGFTFAVAMRAFLRADPDVIMVGEMRDRETVNVSVEASLTGHLVLSTMHTNSAPETIVRLVDMGMDPFHFADALQAVLAQRLVRTFCAKCKTPRRIHQAEYNHLKNLYGPLFEKTVNIPYSNNLSAFKAAGCAECNNSGYKGRMGLYELLVGSESIKKMIINKANVHEIRELAIKEGMSTLLREGIRNVFLGHTDFTQVTSVCAL